MVDKWIDRIKFANSGFPLYLHLIGKQLVKSSDHARLLFAPYLPAVRIAENPLFIISCGRSGSTLLFRLLSASGELKSLKRENPALGYYLRKATNKHDQYYFKLTEKDAYPGVIEVCRKAFFLYYGKRRFVDKLPAYCYYVRFLRALFPNAKFIFLYRGPLGNINSLMNAWRHRRFLGRKVPVKLNIQGYDGENWVGPFFSNWQDYKAASLEEVCAQQWISAHEVMLEDREVIPLENRYELLYETLVSEPLSIITEVSNFLGISVVDKLREAAWKLEPLNAVTAPREDKWKDENPGLSRVVPVTRETLERLHDSVRRFRKESIWCANRGLREASLA